MPDLDRRALLKAFLGASLVAASVKALPPSEPPTVPADAIVTNVYGESSVTGFELFVYACPFVVGDVVRIDGWWKCGELLFNQLDALTPLEFYREFELVHPFVDGNGRTGKILLNWLNESLLDPIFPPNDFWGWPIRNP